jgi:hypothetical protein
MLGGWGRAALVAVGLVASIAAPVSAATAAQMRTAVGQYLAIALTAAPQNYDGLRGAAIVSDPGHFVGKIPLGASFQKCVIENTGPGSAVYCQTPFLAGGIVQLPALRAAVLAALPPGFIRVEPGPVEDSKWENATTRLAVVLLFDRDRKGGVQYDVWVQPMQ